MTMAKRTFEDAMTDLELALETFLSETDDKASSDKALMVQHYASAALTEIGEWRQG